MDENHNETSNLANLAQITAPAQEYNSINSNMVIKPTKKKKTGLIVSILVILLILLGYGVFRLSVSHNAETIEEEIISELSQRYDKDFEIIRLRHEFNGQDTYYRAICKEKNDSRTFTVYYNPDEENSLIDEYINMAISDSYSTYIAESNDDILFALVETNFSGERPTSACLEEGVKYCLDLNNYTASTKNYIFIKNDVADKENFEKSLIEYSLDSNIYNQAVYFIYIDEADYQEIKDKYNDVYILSVDSGVPPLKEDDKIRRVTYWLVKPEGLKPEYYKVVK